MMNPPPSAQDRVFTRRQERERAQRLVDRWNAETAPGSLVVYVPGGCMSGELRRTAGSAEVVEVLGLIDPCIALEGISGLVSLYRVRPADADEVEGKCEPHMGCSRPECGR
jgi:hypothetical protein